MGRCRKAARGAFRGAARLEVCGSQRFIESVLGEVDEAAPAAGESSDELVGVARRAPASSRRRRESRPSIYEERRAARPGTRILDGRRER